MKRVSPYLKMRVLGAIEFAPGTSIVARIRHVSGQVFTDEDGERFQFTWRTIQTWYSRYKKDGITSMKPKPAPTRAVRARSSRKRCWKPSSRCALISAARTTSRRSTEPASSGVCSSGGAVAPNTFRRIVKEYELLKPEAESQNKRRLAFAKAHANQLWQADTMFGPYVRHGAGHEQAKLIAFIDDASRVFCHGEFFFDENIDTLIAALRSALYKRGVPDMLYVDNGSIYCSQEITLICPRLGCLLCHTPVRDAAAKGKIERFFRSVRDQFLIRKLDLSSLEALNAPSPPGSKTSTTPPSTPPRHEAHRPLRHRPRPHPLPAAERAQRRALLRRSRSATCSPTTPSRSRTPASKRRAICAIARSRSATTAKASSAPSSTTRASAWARPGPSTSSPMTANR